MSYSKATNFTAKDSLPTGNPAKLIKGVDLDTEFNAIQAASVASDAAIAAHLVDTVDAHDASAISNVAAGNIVATDIQAAINELDSEKAKIAGDFSNTFAVATATADTHAVPKLQMTQADAATLSSAQTYADALVVGLWDDRGAYDASVNTFPAGGGSGTAGAIKKGDIWTISVAGTLGGVAVTAGDAVRAIIDTPGQTAANWALQETNFGYTPENLANKVTSVSGASTNDQYPSAKLLYDQLALKQDTLVSASNIKTINSASLLGSGNISVEVAGAAATAETNAKAYADTIVVGLWDDRGAYDASVNIFPSAGGSGTAGAVLKGDIWTVSVAGTLGGVSVGVGDTVRALINTPGQTASNWALQENNIGYVPENTANKVTSLSGASTDTQYPSAKLAYDQFALKAPLISPSFTTPILGTPTSGDLRNCSLAVAPAIGGTTPAAGAFTTLSAAEVIADNIISNPAIMRWKTSGARRFEIHRELTTEDAVFYKLTGAAGSESASEVLRISNATGALNGTSIQNTPIGSTTASTGAFTTLSASEPITVTKATGVPKVTLIATTGTNEAYFNIANTGGAYYYGVENSAGSWFGGTAYAMVRAAPAGKVIQDIIAGSIISTTSSTGFSVTGTISGTSTIKTGGYTVGTLPAGVTGDRAYVTDATAPTYLGALTGGGAVVCPVFKNATAWVSA